MTSSTTDEVPKYGRNICQSIEIYDLGGIDKRFPPITKLTYYIYSISSYKSSSLCDSGRFQLSYIKHDTIISPKSSLTKQITDVLNI